VKDGTVIISTQFSGWEKEPSFGNKDTAHWQIKNRSLRFYFPPCVFEIRRLAL
jgi:hypothetical protein